MQTTDTGSNIEEKWGVLVVHGVGDTGPGVTVDNFLWSLVGSGAGLKPDGIQRVVQFTERPAGGRVDPDPPAFQVHVRHAGITRRAGAGPTEAVFAEVYWADLSRIREGKINLLLGLVSMIFFLRFIPDWAAAVNGRLARVLRWLLHGSSWLLCGPIAALNAHLVVLAGGYLWVVRPFLPAWGEVSQASVLGPGAVHHAAEHALARGQIGLGSLCAAATVAAAAAAVVCRWRKSGSTWTWFWDAAAVIGVGLTLAILLLPPTAWGRHLQDLVPERIGPANRFCIAVLLAVLVAIRLLFVVLIGYLGVTTLVWLWAWVSGSGDERPGAAAAPGTVVSNRPEIGESRPALAAALGATLIQLALWVLVVPPVLIVAARTLTPGDIPDDTRGAVEALFFPETVRALVFNLLATAVAVVVAGVVLVGRARWAKGRGRTYQYPPGPDIPRLVVHYVLVTLVIAMSAAGSAAFVYQFFSTNHLSDRGNWSDPVTAPAVSASGRQSAVAEEGRQGADRLVSGLIVTAATLGGALLAGGVRNALHILMDVINHFYRRNESIPPPWGPQAVDVQQFEVQQQIEYRFWKALEYLLADPAVTHLTIVAHSQGTIVAVDVLSQTALSDQERDRLTKRLGGLTKFTLVTMGSPLTHLYQHYFPARYPSLTHREWDAFSKVIRQWVNLFRVDDYIGTDIEIVGTWDQKTFVAEAWCAKNIPVGAGGHTGYWRDRKVHAVLLGGTSGRNPTGPLVPG